CIVDLASGLGQDTYALARRALAQSDSLSRLRERVAAQQPREGRANARRERESDSALASRHRPPLVVGIEPSQRMIRFGPRFLAPREAGAPDAPGQARFVRGLGEEIPVRSGAVDAVLCKGALDHFMDPDLTLREIARVLRPGGRAVIALANYGSLSCVLGRWLDRGRPLAQRAQPPYYEPPPDHLTRFSYGGIVALARPPLRIRKVEGVSLLWGFPPWGRLLQRLPAPGQSALLYLAHGLAKLRPAWADVVVLVADRCATP
ncbi:MAG: class I SAM-dependent methyltransferase, partial [SAR324 cluster bacterium]